MGRACSLLQLSCYSAFIRKMNTFGIGIYKYGIQIDCALSTVNFLVSPPGAFDFKHSRGGLITEGGLNKFFESLNI